MDSKKRLKILKVVYDFPPPWIGLGPGMFELANAQGKKDDITVLTGNWPREKAKKEKNFRTIPLPRKLGFLNAYFTYYLANLIFVGFLGKTFDLIHGHNYHPFYYHFFRFFFKGKIPYVLSFHMNCGELIHQHATKFSWFTRISVLVPLKISEKVGCRTADAIICVSESIKEEIIRWYGANPEKITVIENGVNISLFNRLGENLRHSFGLQKAKVLLYVGRLYHNKNVDVLIQTLHHLPAHYRLLIVGEGEQKQSLIALTKKENLNDKVTFCDYVSYHKLPEYYRTADLFCLLSKLEGNPKVILEALACETPVLSTHSFRPSPFLQQYINFVDFINVKTLALKIKNCVESKKDYDFKVFREKYDWQGAANKIGQIYEKVLEKRSFKD